MNRKPSFLIAFMLFLVSLSPATLKVQKAEASGTIYIRADGSIDPLTAPIRRNGNVYTLTGNITISTDADGIVVERDNIIVDGAGFVVEGTGAYDWHGIYLDGRSNVTIKTTNITNYGYGIYFDSSSGNSISGNNITNNAIGIVLNSSCSNNVLSSNNITNNLSGIALGYSSNNALSGNTVTANTNYGIALAWSSSNNTLSDNNVSANSYYGIWLSYSCDNNNLSGNNIANNSVGIGFDFSSNNTLSCNTVTVNSHYGIYLKSSSNNFISHNNFVNNTNQVITEFSANVWDDGYPSGGTYWSDYNGTDIKSGSYQNSTGSDGIGDTSYVIDANNTDRYPLMGMFSDFDWASLAAPEQRIQTICNSTISNLVYNGTAISFNVTGEDGTAGVCRICIPAILLNVTYKVFVNGTEVTHSLLPFSNETYRYLYFNYTHSTKEVVVIPEFPTFLILPLFFALTLLAVIVHRRKCLKRVNSPR